MNTLRLFLVVAGTVGALCASVPAEAADISHDTGQDYRQGEERSETSKESAEERDSQTKRRSRSISQGGETNRSSTDRESASMGRGGGLDLTISARDLFGSDGLTYRLPADFGLSAKRGRMVNATYQEWLNGMAKNNAPVSEATDEGPLLDYYREVATAGAVLGQAMIYLQEDVSRFGGVKRTKAALEISSIGAEDLMLLAKGSLARAQQGITDTRIATRLREILADIDRNPCVFAGEATNIKCGQSMLSLAVPPRLTFRGSEWYGGKYAGADAQYKISSNWSYSKALENAHGNSSYGRWATEQSEATEQMASEGKGYDAVQTRRAAIEKIKGNKANLSPGRLLPGIQ